MGRCLLETNASILAQEAVLTKVEGLEKGENYGVRVVIPTAQRKLFELNLAYAEDF